MGDWAEEMAHASVTTHPKQKAESVVKVMDSPPGRTNKQIICNKHTHTKRAWITEEGVVVLLKKEKQVLFFHVLFVKVS